jgi:hypothetical protein
VSFFSYFSHTATFEVKTGLNNSTMKRCNTIALRTYLIDTALYLVIAILGYYGNCG